MQTERRFKNKQAKKHGEIFRFKKTRRFIETYFGYAEKLKNDNKQLDLYKGTWGDILRKKYNNQI